MAVVGTSSRNPYQLERWNTFLDPWSDPRDTAFHTIQGLFALALGRHRRARVWVRAAQPGGLYLPNADNDFIFAMVGQELGLIGGLLVIGLFLFFA